MKQIDNKLGGTRQEKLHRCRQTRVYDGDPSGFWQEFLESVTSLADAMFAFVSICRDKSDAWNIVCLHPLDAKGQLKTPAITQKIEELVRLAERNGDAAGVFEPEDDKVCKAICLVAVRLETPEKDVVSVLVTGFDKSQMSRSDEILNLLQLLADTPMLYQLKRVEHQSKIDVVRFAEVLDVSILLNLQKRYIGAAMTLCNEIAARYGCDRVSFGWVVGGYVRLQAISHIEKFEKKMVAVLNIELLMEEAIGQDEEVLFPAVPGSAGITKSHEKFARENGVDWLATFPIRLDDELVGALTCEKTTDEMFTETQVQSISLICDQSARRINDLRESDRWFGHRFTSWAKKGIAELLGFEHTYIKLAGIVVTCLLVFLIFGRLPFRVEAPFIVKTDDLVYLPASYDGYIETVFVDVGDLVVKGSSLLNLDDKELLLEESKALANKIRYDREAQKAQAANSLSAMEVAKALSDQADAELKLVRYHLDNAHIIAPFDGVVVEGDLKKMLGAPVRKGDVLFKLARIDKMYAELDVDERDIHLVKTLATGEIAFVSQPKFKYPIEVKRIDPVAVTKEKGNKFLVRGEFSGAIDSWWRPGMSGISKINAGTRNVAWIISRRTVDFLRLFLWW